VVCLAVARWCPCASREAVWGTHRAWSADCYPTGEAVRACGRRDGVGVPRHKLHSASEHPGSGRIRTRSVQPRVKLHLAVGGGVRGRDAVAATRNLTPNAFAMEPTIARAPQRPASADCCRLTSGSEPFGDQHLRAHGYPARSSSGGCPQHHRHMAPGTTPDGARWWPLLHPRPFCLSDILLLPPSCFVL
jgi:hypothetical protein